MRKSEADENGAPVRVTRFAQEGGAGLKGQVVDAETGRPLAGIVVEVHLEGRFMASNTESNGTFRMSGLLPGKRVSVWAISEGQLFVAEYAEVQVLGEGETSDAGILRLLRGNEVGPNLGGWVGLFVGHRGQRNVVTAVNPWSPADRAGITIGTVILSVEGRSVEGLGPRATGFLLRGPTGTKVSLTLRDEDGAARKVELERVPR